MGLIFDAFFAGTYPAKLPAAISIRVAENTRLLLTDGFVIKYVFRLGPASSKIPTPNKRPK